MPHRRSAAAERELLRQWNESIPIDGREREPPLQQCSIDDCEMGRYNDGELDDLQEPQFDEEDCGWMGPKLGCSAAGSEVCDFECPTRAMIERQARLARRRKKKGEG